MCHPLMEGLASGGGCLGREGPGPRPHAARGALPAAPGFSPSAPTPPPPPHAGSAGLRPSGMQRGSGCLAAGRPLSFLSSGAETETPAAWRMRQSAVPGAGWVTWDTGGHGCRGRKDRDWVLLHLASGHCPRRSHAVSVPRCRRRLRPRGAEMGFVQRPGAARRARALVLLGGLLRALLWSPGSRVSRAGSARWFCHFRNSGQIEGCCPQ